MEQNIKKKSIKLQDVNIDGRFRVRDIDSHIVKVFKDRRNVGIDLTSKEPFVLDQNNNLISGHHRYEALMEIDPDCKVKVIIKQYESLKERLVDAGNLNNENGFPLTEYEQKRLAFRLKGLKADEEEIVKAIGRPSTIIDRWFGQAVVVIHPDGHKEKKARKGGLPKTIEELSLDQYEKLHEKGSGWSPSFHIYQIILHLSNNTIDLHKETSVQQLTELYEKIGAVLSALKKEGAA